MVRNIGHPFVFHIDATIETQDLQAGSREGMWWLPKDTTSDYLVLTNQGKITLPLDLSLYDANGKESKQKVLLGPHETMRYSVRKLILAAGLTGSYGGIKVTATAHAGSLDTVHFLFDESAAFSAILKMFDHDPNARLEERDFAKTAVWTLRAPMLALSSPDPALAFPPGTSLRPQLFIRNTTGKPVDAALRFNWRADSTSGKAAGPVLRLNPYETRRIDVAALQNSGLLPKQANWTSVTLTTNGPPDEVMAVAASYDDTLRYGAQTPFSDQLSFQWEGGMWEYDAYHSSIITAGNGGTKLALAAFTIFYNQGAEKYELEQTLQPDDQMWIDVGKLIREHVPDKNGKTLPPDLTSGSYEIRDLTDIGAVSLFEGKIIFDKTYGHVAYGCANCCDYQHPFMTYNTLDIPFQGTAQNGVTAYQLCENFYVDVSSYFWNGWYTGNTAIATVSAGGIHKGVSVGSTSSSTNGYIQDTQLRNCPSVLVNVNGTAKVVVVPKIMFGGKDITGTTQSVVVGQQIALTASYPAGVTVNSQSWSVPGTIVAGYTASSSSGSLNTNVTLNHQSTTFYWILAGSYQVTFTLNYGSSQTATATASFNISAPSPATPTVSNSVLITVDTLTGCAANPGGQFLVFGNLSGAAPGCGNPGGTPGISFAPPTTQTPAGSFSFVQLINSDTTTYSRTGATLTCSFSSGLDTQYPYPVNNVGNATDAPEAPLPSTYTTASRSFSATMYLMWQSGSTTFASIPIPIGSVAWQFSGSATEPQQNSTWGSPTGSGSAGNFTAATGTSSIPTWSNIATRTCQ
jgi:hypothetical protein